MTAYKQEIFDDYVYGLSAYEWDFFCTFTTSYELTLSSARRLMERYHSKVKNLGVKPYLFWVAEKYEAKDGFHTHGVIKTNASPHLSDGIKKCLFTLWQDVSVFKGQKSNITDGKVFNRCDIRMVDPKRRLSEYLCKYITKGVTDYDFLT